MPGAPAPINTPQPHPVDVVVGRNLRRVRQERHMSQTALGDALGVTFQQVQKYERGVNRVSASTLFEIARVLGMDIAAFFDGVPQDDAARLAQVPDLSAVDRQLLRIVNTIQPRARRALILKLARALAGVSVQAQNEAPPPGD